MVQTLAPEQSAIVDQWLEEQGPMLVEASAGSGKTRMLTECVRRIITSDPKSRAKILCLTFTNKAADEIEDRLSSINNLKNRTFIGTIHGFALDIIKSRKHELGMDEMPTIIDKESDKKEILAEVILSNPYLSKHYLNPSSNVLNGYKSLKDYQSKLIKKSIDFISSKKKELITIDDDTGNVINPKWSQGKVILYKEYNSLLRNQNLIDYDDIILLAWKILDERPAVANLYRRIYSHVLVDEAQDLSFAQYEFLRSFCSEAFRNIIMVGDPNQAIHGYAGASSEYMSHRFVADFGLNENQKKRIKYNYRSSKAIIDLANRVAGISQNTIESYYEGKTDFYCFSDESSEAAWVIDKLKQLIHTVSEAFDGELTLDKVAVLGRNRYVFDEIITRLNEEPQFVDKFYLKRGTEVIDPQSTTLKIFDLGTRILCNNRANLYQRQLAGILNLSDDLDFTAGDNMASLDDALKKSKVPYLSDQIFNALREAWLKIEISINNLTGALDTILFASASITEDNERDLINNDIVEWREAWSNYIRTVKSQSKSINDFRRYIAMGVTKNQDHEGLTLASVHTVKGLEYYVVFLLGVGQGTFPDYRATDSSALLEEKNNIYVAITRAKRELYISYPKVKSVPWGTKSQQKSEFFRDINFQTIA